VLRRIFRPKWEEGARGWRRLHNEELHTSYASPNICRVIKSMRMIWAGHDPRIGKMRNAHNIFVGKHEGKKALGRFMRRREDNIRMDFREIRWEGVDWMHLARIGTSDEPL
jgi:hypothetical protein